jgi:A/G-specific adenine glycosylase
MKSFSEKIITWSVENPREMPWKGIKNPYFIWLSEVILQQTRVEQGLPYYLKFTTNYPTVKNLADAPEDEVMKCWEGLGYYSRARNLHAAAKYIAYECNEIFPNTYDEILKIKGVGAYTAAAISSFAFDLPQAVVDGNVYRVLSRIFGISTPIDSSEGQKEFKILAEKLLNPSAAAAHNQAIMNFGAMQCTPKLPLCKSCPFSDECKALQVQNIHLLPVKSKKIKRTTRFFNYFYFSTPDEKTYIRKRTAKDIWLNLYEFPMIESEFLLEKEDLEKEIKTFFPEEKFLSKNQISKPFKHELTHQSIIAQFFEVKINQEIGLENSDWNCIFEKDLKKFAFPKLIDLYISDKNVSLTLF